MVSGLSKNSNGAKQALFSHVFNQVVYQEEPSVGYLGLTSSRTTDPLPRVKPNKNSRKRGSGLQMVKVFLHFSKQFPHRGYRHQNFTLVIVWEFPTGRVARQNGGQE